MVALLTRQCILARLSQLVQNLALKKQKRNMDCCILNKTRGTMSKPIKSGKKHGNTFCKIHEADSNNLKNTHLFQCNCCLNLGIPYCPEARHPHELKSNQIIKLLSPVMKKLIGHIDQEQHGIRFSLTHFF